MNAAVECEGSPRDLGRDQARACGASLRERFAALPVGERLRLRLSVRSGPERALGRELSRHFPRQAETLAGLATAARVPAAWLVACLAREAATPPAELAAAAGREITGSGAVVGRRLAGQWIVRRSRPEGAFRSVELTRPWLAHPLLGVNEVGLAVAVVGGNGARGEPRRGRVPPFAWLPAAPFALDCLQRFATLEACLEWCMGRPGELPAALLLADARGEIAGIEIGPDRRRILRPAEGWLAVGGEPADRERMAKTLREQGRLGAEFALAEPATRSLRLGSARYEVLAG